MASMAEIVKVGKEIGRAFQPERVVLFGSHARGEATPDSDVDLLVVMQHGEPKSYRVATKIRCHIRPDFPVDLLVRTPDELLKRISLGDSFMKEILEEGVVLYESAS